MKILKVVGKMSDIVELLMKIDRKCHILCIKVENPFHIEPMREKTTVRYLPVFTTILSDFSDIRENVDFD